jgi:putative ABC transport system permease protein
MALSRLKHVVRRLLRAPLFTIMTLVTLAIGIGANTAVFSVIEGILLKPLPFEQPDKLVGVWHDAPGLHIGQVNMCPALYFTYRDQNKSFEGFGLWNTDIQNVTGLAEPERIRSLTVTDGLLPVLGVRPLLGRSFTRSDDSPGTPETVMLTYGYWQTHFGGDPSAIGRRIMLDGVAHEIIGVLPASFDFMDTKPGVLTTFRFDRNKTFLGNFSYQGIGRLKPGVTLAQANADIARLIPIGLHEFPPPPGFSVKLFEDAHLGPDVHPLKEDVIGDIGKVLWVLMGTIGLVLLIACANAANLMLVRADGRQQELAIRAALGAGWGRIARELMLESVLLGLCGGLLGLTLAYGAIRVLVAVAPANLPRLGEISIDGTVLFFTMVISLAVGLLFGLIPVFKYAGPSLGSALRAGGRSLSQSRERHRARSVLVVVQLALALVLLISSGLMIRTFAAMRNTDPGFVKSEQLQTFRISIPETEAKEPERAIRMHQQIIERIRAIPGVTAVGATTSLPMEGQGWTDLLFAQDHVYAEGKMPPLRRFHFVSPGLFSTMGTRLVAGRDFSWSETFDMTPIAIVSEKLARELWREPSAALGKRVREGPSGTWREVIGVVGDVHDDGMQKPVPTTVYWPILLSKFESGQNTARRELAYVVRSDQAGSSGLMKQLQQAVWALDSSLPVADVRTLEEITRRSMARTSFTLVMLSLAGGMALLLGVVGVYGVISYSVSQRTREIGIRLAIGAQQPEVMRLFVRHGLILSSIGVAFGLAAAAGLTRLMSSLLFNVQPVDPITYAAVSVSLILGTMAASYLPARKVSSVDPVEALRAE